MASPSGELPKSLITETAPSMASPTEELANSLITEIAPSMASPFEELANSLITEIFGKTQCSTSLVRCTMLAKRFEPLVLNVDVHTLSIPITIRERFFENVTQSVPPPRRRSARESAVVWIFIKTPLSLLTKLSGMIRKLSATPALLAPPLPNILVHWDREILTLGVSSLQNVFVAYMNYLKQSTFFPKIKPPHCLELVLTFPDSTHRSVSLIKWRGFRRSTSDFYFIMLIRENVHEIGDGFVVPDPYQYRWRSALIFFKNFWLMAGHAQTGNWFSSVQDIAISYTRSGLHAMREELTNPIPVVEYKTRGKRWMQNVVRFPERKLELNGVNLVIIKGEHSEVEDNKIIEEAFKQDELLFKAALQVYGMDIPIIF